MLGYKLVAEGVTSAIAACCCPNFIHSSIPLVFEAANLVIFWGLTKKFTKNCPFCEKFGKMDFFLALLADIHAA